MDKIELNQNSQVLTEEKLNELVPCLNIPLDNPLYALQRRLGFKVSDFSFQICSISEKELQCMNVIMRCKECMCNNRDYFWHLL
jgi:hypothetical protein